MELLFFQELTEKLLDVESGRMALKNEVNFFLPLFLLSFSVCFNTYCNNYETSYTDFQKFSFTLVLPILLPKPNKLFRKLFDFK